MTLTPSVPVPTCADDSMVPVVVILTLGAAGTPPQPLRLQIRSQAYTKRKGDR